MGGSPGIPRTPGSLRRSDENLRRPEAHAPHVCHGKEQSLPSQHSRSCAMNWSLTTSATDEEQDRRCGGESHGPSTHAPVSANTGTNHDGLHCPSSRNCSL